MKEIILILILQLVYVPILTLRTIFMVKGQTLFSSLFGMVESLIYVFGLSLVFSGDQSGLAMVVYAVGFGLGILIGGYVESLLAIGYTNLNVKLASRNESLINELRELGFGVTVFEGEGRDGKRYQLDILTRRDREKELMKIIETHEPRAFIISYEPRKFKGGFLLKGMKKAKHRK
ncbi:DUF2179 domain-containing protein [Peribacillus deserti]|uniref:UPF0316 protein CUU66_18010 n=1 Tax=Peribacillus deserti TaxID=673318 RepID=A0A2N5M2I9_9BACI|nr:DUF2179 domain-containing protein [Peribacillus deserti]PLT28577.1 hypothetical protein CUU66_18010 [Peribacillus deserti]